MLLDLLHGGDLRSIGASDAVVRIVLADGRRFSELVDGLAHSDRLVRMRAADACEKITRIHPEWLSAAKDRLLDALNVAADPELKWHLAQMLPRLQLTTKERSAATGTLRRYLHDRSRIVRVSALQALFDLARSHPRNRRSMRAILRRLVDDPSPAMRARAAKLLATDLAD